jgi:hypothetical protein
MNQLAKFFEATHTKLGLVFYPTHCILAAFPSLALARDARTRLIQSGFAELEVFVVSHTKVLEFFKEFRDQKNLWERFVRDERARAGAGFVADRCRTKKDIQRIRRDIEQFSPIGMQWYRSIGIEY